MSCTKKEYKKIELIIVTILVFLFVQVVFTACSDNSNTNDNGNNAVEDNGNDSDSENNDNNDTDKPVEYVTVSITRENFSDYFTVSGNYNLNSTLLYNEYYQNTQIVVRSVFNYLLTYNFTVSLKDDTVKIISQIKGVAMNVTTGLGWTGGSYPFRISENGYTSGMITASAKGTTPPNTDWAFTLDVSQVYGKVLVPQDNVK